jgi:hypothetical protein
MDTTRKPVAPQEAHDEMRPILKQIIMWNDKWNDGRYLSLDLVGRSREDGYGSVSYNNDFYQPDAKQGLGKYYDQDELRAEIAAKEEA